MSQAASSTSSSEPTRRRWLGGAVAAGAAGLLAGCGFRPLHGEAAAGPADPELAAVRVALIPERVGQLLRRDLQQRLDPNGAGTAARYELRVTLAYAGEPIGFRRDGTPSRVRNTATATWTLLTMATPPEPVATGVERALDSYNIPDNQFFAADVSRDALDRRLMRELADGVARRLAVELARRRAAA